MQSKVFIFDPTANDQLSRVRGIGRYLQILRENFDKTWIFTDSLKRISTDSIFINPFFNFLLPPLTMRKIAKKQIAVIHDLIPLKYPTHFPIGIKGKLNVFLNKLSLRNYDLIITDSVASKKDIIQTLHVDENNIKVIYPCLPKIFSISYSVSSIQKKNSEYKIPNTGYCIYVGDATWNKNLVNLAKAIKLADVNCVFVGKVFENNDSGVTNAPQNDVILTSERRSRVQNLNHVWQKELYEFLQEVKNDKHFIFLGYIPDEQLINLYQQARCNILPSRDEGFGFSYVEASTIGCPSILSDIPVFREISNNKAFFFEPENVQELANLIKEAFSDNPKQKQIKKQAKNRSLFFSRKQFKKKFLETIS